jgi:formylglycine-generating enzyme required for sulfatase activity/predicted Ser/Thr protein kinase
MTMKGLPSDKRSGSSESSPSSENEAFDYILRAVAHAPARTPPTDAAEGTRWGADGRYVVQGRLGRGGMGTVYLASDTLLGRLVALKVLDARTSQEDTAHRARLLREARLAAALEHERVARVYDVGEHEGSAFVAMEYVRGFTLRAWMAEEGRPRAPGQIVTVATQIAQGLAVLHANGVIHRDLKPENVMMTEQGNVKLVDFGLARQLVLPTEGAMAGDSEGVAALALDAASLAAVLGTPGYMAPEQCRAEKVDARADVFALGVIVYELVTGERPFRGKTLSEVLKATLEGALTLTGPAWDRMPARVGRATARMLERDREARFADGGEVTRALQYVDDAGATEAAPKQRRPLLRWAMGGSLVLAAIASASAAPRVKRELAHRKALAKPPPLGMVLVNEGTVTVGQSADTVARQCAEIGPQCPAKVLSYQVPATPVDVPPFLLDVREVTNREMVDVLNGATETLHVEPDENDQTPRYVRLDAGLGSAESFLADLEPKLGGIEYTAERLFRARRGREAWPVNQVTWFGSRFYCSAQGKRLPTENEWEAAARGHEDRVYPWGNSPPRCGEVVIPNDGLLTVDGCPETVPLADVATARQDVTPQGVRDLGGSVAEWVDTVYSGEGRDRVGTPAVDAPRVIRGGSFFFSYMARTSVRNKRPANTAHFNVGFRCAVDIH